MAPTSHMDSDYCIVLRSKNVSVDEVQVTKLGLRVEWCSESMLLTDYQWSGNVRGMHITGAGSSIDHGRYTRAKFGWVKLVVEDTRYVTDVVQFLAEGITPMVRLYRRCPGPATVTNDLLSVCQAYVNGGNVLSERVWTKRRFG